MQYTAKVTVTGAKKFKDSVEGKAYDSTTLFVQIGMDERQGSAKGYATQSYTWGTSEEFDKIKHLPFPFEAEVTFENVTTGKAMKQLVVDVKPVNRASVAVKS